MYLYLKSKGTASWIIRYQLFGKRRQYKIGGYGKGHEELLALEDAIKFRIDCRQKLNDGIDPKLDFERQQQRLPIHEGTFNFGLQISSHFQHSKKHGTFTAY